MSKRAPKPVEPTPTKPQPCTAAHARERSQSRGWAQHQLALVEFRAAGRWAWWLSVLMTGWLDDREIPRVEFMCRDEKSPYPLDEKLNAEAGWRSRITKDAVALFQECERQGVHRATVLDYWLFAFGDADTERPTLPDAVEVALYQSTIPWRMLFHPADWGATILCDLIGRSKDHTAWFPTPMHVTELMVRMTMATSGEDMRLKTFMEPCCGTGGMLLAASNHSLRLYACDIDPEMVRWTKFSCYLYVPWAVKPGDVMVREIRAAIRREREQRVEPPTDQQSHAHVTHGALFV